MKVQAGVFVLVDFSPVLPPGPTAEAWTKALESIRKNGVLLVCSNPSLPQIPINREFFECRNLPSRTLTLYRPDLGLYSRFPNQL